MAFWFGHGNNSITQTSSDDESSDDEMDIDNAKNPVKIRLFSANKKRLATISQLNIQELEQVALAKFPQLKAELAKPSMKIKFSVVDPKTFEAKKIKENADVEHLEENSFVRVEIVERSVPSKNYPAYQWMWKDDNNQWRPYQPQENRLLEEAYQKGVSNIVLNGVYRIEVKQRKQSRKSSGKQRDILRATWFWVSDNGKAVPYEELIANMLEESFQEVHSNSALPSKKVPIDPTRFCLVSRASTRQYRHSGGNANGRDVIRGYLGKVIPVRKKPKVWICPSSGYDLISLLPYEILVHVASFLDIRDINAFSQTCRLFSRVFHDEMLWKEFCLRDLDVTTKEAGINSWKVTYKILTSLQWDSSTLSDWRGNTLYDNNRTVVHSEPESKYAAVRSKVSFTKGVHRIAIRINQKPSGEFGVGFVDDNFDCVKNQYINKAACKCWLYWTLGRFYEVTGMTIPHLGSHPSYAAGDVIEMTLDMDKKTLQFDKRNKNGQLTFVRFFTIDAQKLWLVTNLYSKGDSITICRWNETEYSTLECVPRAVDYVNEEAMEDDQKNGGESSDARKKKKKRGFFARLFAF